MKNLSNQKFGRLLVLKQFGKNKWGNLVWLCQCDCGNKSKVASGDLLRGNTQSCGCYRSEVEQQSKNMTHGQSYTRLYRIWIKMKERCFNPNHRYYKYYGGKGIKVCREWKEFKNFYQDLSKSYHLHEKKFGIKDTTLDRIDSDGDYKKGNVHWATRKEQAENRR